GVQTCALPISPKNEPSVKKTGGNTSHAVNNDPVAISILFVIAGTVMPTRPLTLIKAVKLTAASRPQNTPVAERPSSEAPHTSAPSNEPTNNKTSQITPSEYLRQLISQSYSFVSILFYEISKSAKT